MKRCLVALSAVVCVLRQRARGENTAHCILNTGVSDEDLMSTSKVKIKVVVTFQILPNLDKDQDNSC